MYPPPYHQFKNGVEIDEIKCNENKVLLIRTSNEKPICVNEESYNNTINLGIAILLDEFFPDICSPDFKGKILFKKRDSNNLDDLYIYEETGLLTRLTTDPIQEMTVSWSSDNEKIAFVKVGGDPLPQPGMVADPLPKDWKIQSINKDGSNLRNLIISTPGNIFEYTAFSPDNSKIVFASFGPEGESKLHVIESDGNLLNTINLPSRAFDPAWSPDGTKIGLNTNFGNGTNIGVMNADGSEIQGVGFGRFLQWSPNENQILFRADEQIYIMNSDGSNQTNLSQIIEKESLDMQALFSPDGSKIVFERVFNWKDSPQIFSIYTMNSDGSNKIELTRSNSPIDILSWSPDGQMILYGIKNEMWIIDSDGSCKTKIMDNYLPGFGIWRALNNTIGIPPFEPPNEIK